MPPTPPPRPSPEALAVARRLLFCTSNTWGESRVTLDVGPGVALTASGDGTDRRALVLGLARELDAFAAARLRAADALDAPLLAEIGERLRGAEHDAAIAAREAEREGWRRKAKAERDALDVAYDVMDEHRDILAGIGDADAAPKRGTAFLELARRVGPLDVSILAVPGLTPKPARRRRPAVESVVVGGLGDPKRAPRKAGRKPSKGKG